MCLRPGRLRDPRASHPHCGRLALRADVSFSCAPLRGDVVDLEGLLARHWRKGNLPGLALHKTHKSALLIQTRPMTLPGQADRIVYPRDSGLARFGPGSLPLLYQRLLTGNIAPAPAANHAYSDGYSLLAHYSALNNMEKAKVSICRIGFPIAQAL